MQEFLLTGLLGAGLIVLCGLITYEALRFLWSRLPGLTMPPRQRVFFVVACVFASHIVNIWLFGLTYYFLMNAQLGTMIGTAIERGRRWPDRLHPHRLDRVLHLSRHGKILAITA